jgi:deoxyadenosine/deoxycytidine kinase
MLHVAVSGPIGVGKSTATRILASSLELDSYLEDFVSNPYLERFYKEPSRWAESSQAFFLAQAAHQHRLCTKHGGIQDHSVRDVHLGFDVVLREAGILSQSQFDRLQGEYIRLTGGLQPPTLVVYLLASTETLLRRIQGRHRVFEAEIDGQYLSKLDVAKRRIWENASDVRVEWFDTELNDLSSLEGQRSLINQVVKAIPQEMRLSIPKPDNRQDAL